MERKDSYTMMLEALIQGLIPYATLPVLIKIDDVIQDLALDIDAFGRWFDEYIRSNSISLQEVDLGGMMYKFISHDFKTYMQETYQENPPDLQVYCDEEDSKFTNWQEITKWIEELEDRNPKAWKDGFIQGMYAIPG